MRVVLLGAPGAGKGTQANFLSTTFQLQKISSGDMLRAEINANTEIGQKIAKVLQDGGLADEQLVTDLVVKKINALPNQDDFLLDGFPRTINQAEALYTVGIKIDIVLCLEVPDEEIVRRLSGRRIHLSSGRVYHVDFNPPRSPGLDDATNEPLVQRADDTEDTIKARLKIYHEQTIPLINWYLQHNVVMKSISGSGSVQAVTAAVMQCISSG